MEVFIKNNDLSAELGTNVFAAAGPANTVVLLVVARDLTSCAFVVQAYQLIFQNLDLLMGRSTFLIFFESRWLWDVKSMYAEYVRSLNGRVVYYE